MFYFNYNIPIQYNINDNNVLVVTGYPAQYFKIKLKIDTAIQTDDSKIENQIRNTLYSLDPYNTPQSKQYTNNRIHYNTFNNETFISFNLYKEDKDPFLFNQPKTELVISDEMKSLDIVLTNIQENYCFARISQNPDQYKEYENCLIKYLIKNKNIVLINGDEEIILFENILKYMKYTIELNHYNSGSLHVGISDYKGNNNLEVFVRI